MLFRSDLEFLGNVFQVGAPNQLVSMIPHQYGRIPVVFVHGTASSAGRWAEMVNVLQSDPAIRERYEFWAFSYDTGNPIVYSSMILRDALTDAVHRLDPAGTDPGLKQMVVIGHSQGGLLTKLMAIRSGNRFWQNVSDEWFASVTVNADLIRTQALLPLTRKPIPDALYDIELGTGYRHHFENGWIGGVNLRGGSTR